MAQIILDMEEYQDILDRLDAIEEKLSLTNDDEDEEESTDVL